MPGQGGLHLLRQVMSRKNSPAVIIMTALADAEIAQQAMRLGAFDYVVKPVSFDTLDSLIVACAAHVEYRRRGLRYELEELQQQAAAWIRSLMESSGALVSW